jgi:hypothetical protein
MDFTSKKLPLELAPQMRVCPMVSVQPYAPLPAPLYVLMTSNEKFLAVKAPLDFLLPGDLECLRSFENFFYPPFIRQTLPFRISARCALRLLYGARMGEGLRPAPFEISDAFLRLTAPLWSPDGRIEPFFVSIFITEVCGALPAEIATRAREGSFDTYEQAVLKSAWATWQALHLDYLDGDWLRKFRDRVFEAAALGGDLAHAGADPGWLHGILKSEIPQRGMGLSDLSDGVIRRKLESRQSRLLEQFVTANSDAPSIRGERGFIEEGAA